MFYYKIYGLYVKSDFKLDAAIPVLEFPIHKANVLIHQGFIDKSLTTQTLEEKAKGFGIVYRYEKTRSWARMANTGCFIMQNGNDILYSLHNNYNSIAVSECIINLCLGIILTQKEKLILHGSGVLYKNKALIISGKSGAGKSTLAQQLCLNGGLFMADDAVVICSYPNYAYAYPSFPQKKLCKDSAIAQGFVLDELIKLPIEIGEREKYAFRLKDNYCSEKQKLGAMVVIEIENHCTNGYIRKVLGSEKLKYFTDNLYRSVYYEHVGFSTNQFIESVKILNQIDLYSLVRPLYGLTIEEEMHILENALYPTN